MRNKLKKVFPILAVTLVVLSASILISPIRGVVAEADPATPDTAGLYGGSIIWIEALDLGDNQSRVFVSTQSANSIFYADIDHTAENPFKDVTFQIVPDLDAEAGFGVIQTFAVDDASGWLYFAWWSQEQNSTDNTSRQPGIYRCTTETGSLTQLEFESDKDHGPSGLGYVNSLSIYDGRMFFVEQTWSQEKQTDVCRLRFGTIDPTTGAFTEDSGSRIPIRDNNKGQIMAPVIHPISNLVYILDRGNHWGGDDIDSVIYKSSDPYDALNSSTTFAKIIPPSGTSELVRQYESLGIAPDGAIHLAGWQQTEKDFNESIAIYSTNDGVSWNTGTRDQYCWAWQGPNFAFVNDGSGGYDIITGTMFSDDGGDVWGMLPRTGNVWPHPGAIAFDPNGEDAFYVRTDRGIAVSNDAGYSFSKVWERPDQTNVEDIKVIDLGGNKSGIFIRERENQQQVDPGQPNNNPSKVYYAEIDHSTNPPTYGEFAAVPSMGEGSNWEIWSRFAGDNSSGLLFFEGRLTSDNISVNGLYKTDGRTAPTLVEIESGYASRPLIYNGRMFYVDSSWGGGYWVNGYWVEGHWEGDPQWVEGYYDEENKWIEAHWTEGETWVVSQWVDGYWVEGQPASNLYFGTLDSDGAFTADGKAQITDTSGLWPERMVIDPSDGCIYILNNNMQTGAEIYKSSDAYDTLSSSTTFTKINPPSDNATSYEWRAFGIGPDGRLFLGGWNRSGMTSNTIAYSENDGTSWETVALENEYSGIGDDFAFIDTDTGYDAFCGTMVSSNKGVGWTNLPRKDSNKAYPTSSCVQIDPNDPDVLYVPTSRGVGYSTDAGYHFYEMNEGIEAVQIRDLVLDPSGDNGWAVAKSGVYRVSNFSSDPTWSAPMDPDGNGAQYKVVDMDLTDETGNTVYVGTEWGDRVFKTTDGGDNWKSMGRPQPQFDPAEMAGNWFWPNWCGNVSAITIDPNNSKRVFVGYDTGLGGWGGMEGERVFGQLWVIDENSTQVQQNTSPWMAGPAQQGKDWTQILLYRTDAESKRLIENGTGDDKNNKSYFLKGDVNISNILITSENSTTVIYVAAYYSDENATPVTDEQVRNNGLYDGAGYPLVYDIYRITGDNDSGWKVESNFGKADTAVTALAIDSDGTIYACGKDYNEQTYQSFIDSYKDAAMQEMKEREKEKGRSQFHDEARNGFYDELVYKLFGQGEGHKQSKMGDWDGRFKEMFDKFESKYFANYTGELNDNFNAYYEQSFDEYFNSKLLPEFNKEFDKQFDQNSDQFDNFWQFNRPQQGLKIVYKKAIGGDWVALPIEGLNKAFSMNPGFNNNQATITIGEDPLNSEADVPYVAFNRFIYYLPNNYDKWVLGCEYPMGTEIYVIIGVASSSGAGTMDTAMTSSSKAETVLTALMEKVGLAPQAVEAADNEGAYLYVGTGTGIYGQFIAPSAALATTGSETPGSRSILIPVAGAIAGIVAACGVVFILKKRLSHRTP